MFPTVEAPRYKKGYIFTEVNMAVFAFTTAWLWVIDPRDRLVPAKAESDLILNYLFDVYERNVDIQVRFRWTPGTSAIWNNRITIHNASRDYEGAEARHGTRVAALAEKPYFDAEAPTRRQALGWVNAELEGTN